MVQEQLFLNRVLREVEDWHFSYLILSGLSFSHLEITLCKIVLCIWRKVIFSATITLWKKFILKLSKNEPENIP